MEQQQIIPYQMPQQPYAMPHAGCSCNQPQMYAYYPGYPLGELTDDEASKIISESMQNLPDATKQAIFTEALSGKMDTLKMVIKDVTKKICIAGAQSEFQVALKKYGVPLGIAAAVGIIGYAIYTTHKKGKK